MTGNHIHNSYVSCGYAGYNSAAARFSFETREDPAEEDSFLWSLADLMTLLLIFFVLLYANTLPEPQAAVERQEPIPDSASRSSENQAVSVPPPVPETVTPQKTTPEPQDPKASTEPTGSSEHALDPPDPGMTSDAISRTKIEALKENFSSDLSIRWEEKKPVFVLGEKITFNIGKATLLDDARIALERIIDIIKPLKDFRIIVSGHTDNIAIRTSVFPSNWELSAARAASVTKFLASHGIDPKRLTIQGKSEFHPLVANTSEKNRRMNRRVEISLLRYQ